MAIKFKNKKKLVISSLDDLSPLDEVLDEMETKLKVGVEYTVYLLDHKKSRTLNANKYYFGVVLKTLMDEIGEKNVDLTVDNLHEAMKGRFNAKVIDVDGLGLCEIGETTKKMTQDRFIQYVEQIREWALDTLNIYIPLPQEVIEHDYSDLYVQAYNDYESK
jgi:hypothetical protein